MKFVSSKLVTMVLTMAFSASIYADTVITMKITEGENGESGESKMYIKDKKLRIVGFDNDDDSEDASEAIFDSNLSQMTIIHLDSKQYTVMDKAALNQMKQRIQDMKKQMEAQLAKMPPERAKMMRQAMEGRMGMSQRAQASKKEMKKTGKNHTIGGYSCEVVETISEGVKVREYCVTDWPKLKNHAEISSAMMGMNDFVEEMMETMQGVSANEESSPFSDIKKLNGFPVMIKEFKNGQLQESTELLSISAESISADFFSVPAGFAKRSMMGER